MERSLAEFASTLTGEKKVIFRKLENCLKKLVHATAAVNFNRNCLREKLHLRSISRRNVAPHWSRVKKVLLEREDDARKKEEDETRRKTDLFNQLCWETDEATFLEACQHLTNHEDQVRCSVYARHSRKLFSLHGAVVRNEEQAPGYVNLTDQDLSEAQKSFLNLGLNCHFNRNPKPYEKRIQIEHLIDNLLNLQGKGTLELSPTIIDELVGKAGRQRGHFQSQVLSPKLR